MRNQISIATLIKSPFLILRTVFTICLCASFMMAQFDGVAIRSNDKITKEALDAALNAFGGMDKINSVKSLVISGTETMVIRGLSSGDSTETMKFEIRVRWPDDFIRIRSYPDRKTWAGISQGTILTQLEGVPEIRRKDIHNREIIHSAHMLLGILMKSNSRQLLLTSTNEPEVFDLSFPQSWGVVSKITIDSKTKYPSVIEYPEIGALGGGITIYQFSSDRFSVEGIMFPRVINISSTAPMLGTTTTMELKIDNVRVNPNLTLKDFEVPVK